MASKRGKRFHVMTSSWLDVAVDGSCDLFLPLYADDPDFNPQCPDLNRCYGRSDLCDGFSDCLYIDEVDCEGAFTEKVEHVTLVVTIGATILVPIISSGWGL